MEDKDKPMLWWGWLVVAVAASAALPSLFRGSGNIAGDWVFWVGLVIIWSVFIAVPLVMKAIKAAKEK